MECGRLARAHKGVLARRCCRHAAAARTRRGRGRYARTPAMLSLTSSEVAMKNWTLALATLAMSASSFAADVAKGNFHFGPIKFEPVDAIAYQVEVKDSKPVTIVAFSDFKIDRQGVMDAIDTGGALITQINANQKGSFVMVRLTAPNRCGLGGLIGNGAKQIDLGDSFTSKSSQGVSRVAGECFTPAPGKMFDDAYDFHLTYDQPLLVIPKPASLSAGGGEPGAA